MREHQYCRSMNRQPHPEGPVHDICKEVNGCDANGPRIAYAGSRNACIMSHTSKPSCSAAEVIASMSGISPVQPMDVTQS